MQNIIITIIYPPVNYVFLEDRNSTFVHVDQLIAVLLEDPNSTFVHVDQLIADNFFFVCDHCQCRFFQWYLRWRNKAPYQVLHH